jgi:hypothetical protein
MAEVKLKLPDIKLSGTAAVIAIIIVVGLYGFGVLRSFSNYQNPALEEVIRAELGMDVGNQALQSLEQMRQSGDYSGLQENLEKFDAEAIQILRMNMSRPALGWESREQKTIYVRYQAPNSTEVQERYFRCERVNINSWRFCTRSTAVSFYLEILPF